MMRFLFSSHFKFISFYFPLFSLEFCFIRGRGSAGVEGRWEGIRIRDEDTKNKCKSFCTTWLDYMHLLSLCPVFPSLFSSSFLFSDTEKIKYKLGTSATSVNPSVGTLAF